MKKQFILTFLLLSGIAFAQVGVNTTTPSSTLDITARNATGTSTIVDGILIPRVDRQRAQSMTSVPSSTLIYVNNIATGAQTGTAINIDAVGFYSYNGNAWAKFGTTTNNTVISLTTVVDPNILGYVPSLTATAGTSAPSSVAVGSSTATLQGITTYNGHSYAAYTTGSSVTWYEAYNAAKNMGGYLATFTTDGEWAHVETQLLTPNVLFNTKGAWIGFCKFSWYAGASLTPDPEFKWITGEQPNHDYSSGGTQSVRKINWFSTGEPNNFNGGEGFVHTYPNNSSTPITRNSYTSEHPWNDIPANNPSSPGFSEGFIVEFQQ